MQVNAINSALNFSGKTQFKNNTTSSTPAFEGKEENGNNISNRSLTNATKALALSTLLSLGTAGLTSCSDGLDFEVTHVYSEPIPVDTVYQYLYYPIPGENTVDTVKIQAGYDSPVAPVLKDFFEENGIDTGDGKIPVKMAYLDEYNGPYVKILFNGDKSSNDEMWYDVTTIDYDEDEGKYVEGKNENYYQLGYSSPDKKNQLVAKLLKLRSSDLDKDNEFNYSTISTAMYDLSDMTRYTVDDDGNTVYNGYFTKGDADNSIFYINEYGAKRRYSSIEVESVTPEDTVIEE